MHMNRQPILFDGGVAFYNGVTQDINGRSLVHLHSAINQKYSGVGIDLHPDGFSHRKTAYRDPQLAFDKYGYQIFDKYGRPKMVQDKIPYVLENGIYRKMNSIDDLYLFNLSNDEKNIVKNADPNKGVYFRNGINIEEDKHNQYEWRFYFISLNKKISHQLFMRV